MKKKALFISAPIRSHVLPSFFLADLLSEEYDVTYVVTDAILAESVHKNGFKTQVISRYTVGVNYEKIFIKEQGQKPTFFTVLKCYLNNVLYWCRKKEIDELLEIVKPDVVIIDVYCSTDFLLLYSHSKKIKIAFFNPMPSTYSVEGYPSISDNVWLKGDNSSPVNKSWKLSDFIKSPQKTFLQWVSERQIQKLMKLSEIPSEYGIVENKFIKAFKNVPELLLLPLEFEFSPNIKKDYQHYLGLCQREHRTDTELDTTFHDRWGSVLEKKQQGKRIIYCSFGTFFERADPQLITFINNVIAVVSTMYDTLLICSVNKYVMQTIQAQNKELDDVMFFSRVPQLKVLEIADLFITHGGLGGIKESIFYKVPMLVYPLDLHYDQSGNALKVEHHGIGLKGNFMYEQVPYMKAKINKLLNDKTFKNKISDFQDNITQLYTPNYHENLLNNLLT